MTNDRSLLSIRIADIAIADERIGYFDPTHADGLGSDIAVNGQHDPIHVKRNGNAAKLPWTLVAGLHRLRGAAGIGLKEIDAIQVADASASIDDLRRLELSENLDHRHRRPIELAIFMAERARLEEGIDHPGRVGEAPQARAGRARHAASANDADAGWRARTAAAMGCSLRKLEQYQRLYRAIVEALPDLAQKINFHPLGESLSAMTRLASLNEIARRKCADAILSKPDWQSMDEVLKEAGLAMSTGNRLDPDRPDAAALDAWNRMPLSGRKAHAVWLAQNVTPGLAKDMVAVLKDRGLW